MPVKLKCKAVAALTIGLGLSACGSGSDALSSPSEQDAPMVRVVLIEDDTNGDGDINERAEFAYDTEGRVTTVTTSRLDENGEDDVTAFSYEGAHLISQINSFETILFSIKNDRVASIDYGGYSESRFTYDARGRLSEVVGDAFFFDDDCETVLGPDADPENSLPRYTLQYDSANRLSRATGSYGDDLQISYLADGRVDSMTTSGECSIQGNSSTTFTYDRNRLPLRSETTSDGDAQTELELVYDNGRPANLTIDIISTSGFQSHTVQTLEYNERGLLASVASNISSTALDDGETLSSVRTFSYEDEPCVEQIFTNPADNLLATITPPHLYEAGQRCGFLLEVL